MNTLAGGVGIAESANEDNATESRLTSYGKLWQAMASYGKLWQAKEKPHSSIYYAIKQFIPILHASKWLSVEFVAFMLLKQSETAVMQTNNIRDPPV
jgi:hypothetical protein